MLFDYFYMSLSTDEVLNLSKGQSDLPESPESPKSPKPPKWDVEKLVDKLIKDITSHPLLIGKVIITKNVKKQIISLLEKLPPNSPIFPYIFSCFTKIKILVAYEYTNGEIVLSNPKSFETTSTGNMIKSDCVYIIFILPKNGGKKLMYIGSSTDIRSRLKQHLNNSTTGKGQRVHKVAFENGGLSCIKFGLGLIVPNIFNAFVIENPTVDLTEEEVHALKGISELIIRLYEEYMIITYEPRLNDKKTASFTHLYNKLNPSKWAKSPINVISYLTRDSLRPPFPNRNLAIKTLKLSSTNYRIYINNIDGFESKVFGERIILQEEGKVLVRRNKYMVLNSMKKRAPK